jgi:hypothetical protein
MVPIARSASMNIKKNRSKIEYSLLFIGSIYAMCVMAIGSLLYYLIHEPFTPSSHWFSNLGVGPTAWTFNQGLQGTALFYSAMVIFITARFIHGKISSRIITLGAAICGIVAIVGIWILTTNNMVDSRPLHDIGAYMYFISTPFFTTMITAVMALEKGASKRLWITTLSLTFTSIMMAPLMTIIAGNIGMDPSLVLGSMDPRFGLVRIFEWVSVFTFFLWIHYMAFDYRKFLLNKNQ